MISTIGKFKAATHLMACGYDVFMEVDGKSPFDLVAHKDGELQRVEVKTTTRRSKYNTGWEVQLKSVRSNKTKNVIHNFSTENCDILVVYIMPLDKVCMYNTKDITQKTSLIILDTQIG